MKKILLTIAIILLAIYNISAEMENSSRKLSLDDFVKLVCKNDRYFQEIMIDEIIAKYGKVLDLPVRDLIIDVAGQYDIATTKDGENSPQTSISLSKLFPKSGTEISASYGISFSSINNRTRSMLAVGISQPIIQNAFGRANRIVDKIEGMEYDIIKHQVVEAYEDYLAQLIGLYYNWYAAYANLKAGKTFYKEYEILLNNIKERQASKIALQTDVNKIELQVLSKKESLLTLTSDYNYIVNMIKHSIGSEENIEPEDPVMYKKNEVDFEKDYNDFILKSRTYDILKLVEQKDKLELKKYADALLPSADLFLGYSIYGENFALESDRGKFYIGINMEYPITGEKHRAMKKISQQELKKTLISFTNTHSEIYTDILNLYSQLEKEKKLVDLYERKISIAEDILKDEKQNYSYGRIKLNDLITARNTLEEVKVDKIYHVIQHHLLLIEWQRITDTLVNKMYQ